MTVSAVSPMMMAKPDLQSLLDQLRAQQYTVVGPALDQGAIVYAEIGSVDQLPRGWTDEQSPGQYRLTKTGDDRWFGFVVGPHSWKKYLFPPREVLLNAEKTATGWSFVPCLPAAPRYALLGVRACELAAIAIQDRIFLDGPCQDPVYRQRREQLFIVAVNCTSAASTCFCTSMNTGPRCRQGFDLALTEVEDGFVVEVGTDRGRDILAACPVTAPSADQLDAADRARQRAVDQIHRRMNTDRLPELLLTNLTHPHWKEVGERCLSCTNCTMVCPTCFCSSVNEVRDLNSESVQRERVWDSCFNPDFSYMGGAPVRDDIPSRYRQWLTHKLGTWHQQFGTSGCVGCGRCITWCPVGIDITEEVDTFYKEAGE